MCALGRSLKTVEWSRNTNKTIHRLIAVTFETQTLATTLAFAQVISRAIMGCNIYV